MQKVEFEGTVAQGHLPEPIRQRIASAMKAIPDGKKLRITLTEAKRNGSTPQQRYYFGVIVPAIQYMFMDGGTPMGVEETHHWLMEHVGKWLREVVTPDGEITSVRRSYMDMDTLERETHHSLCRQWAAERGTDIPEPHEGDDQ
jgi:hypothetical protein